MYIMSPLWFGFLIITLLTAACHAIVLAHFVSAFLSTASSPSSSLRFSLMVTMT